MRSLKHSLMNNPTPTTALKRSKSPLKLQAAQGVSVTIITLLAAFLIGLLGGIFWLEQDLNVTLGPATPAKLFDNAYQRIQRDYLDVELNGQNTKATPDIIAFERWKTHYKPTLETMDDAHVAIASMLASLGDSYSRFLPPPDMSEQTMQMDARLSGIGVQIVMREDNLTVVSTMDDSPAQQAGLKTNDIITHVDGKTIKGSPIGDVANFIRGPEGTFVKLTVKRGDKSLVRKIERRTIPLQSVYVEETTNPAIGYIRLSTFLSEQMMGEIDKALDKLANKQALIVDLRGNYGGLLDNATALSDRFLSNGAIVTIQSTEDGDVVNDTTEARKEANDITKKPMIILVDSGSASASEITAAALQENGRATLLGDTTFGKGLVQKVITLADGSGINLTTSRYLTPNGNNIHKAGIKPDILHPVDWMLTPVDSDPQRVHAIKLLEQKLANITR